NALDCFGRDRQRELHVRARRARKSEQGFERSRDLQMRSLRHEPVVERPHRKVDQGVSYASVASPVIAFAGALRQRLERRPHRGTADLVEIAADEHCAVVAARQLEAACLDALGFFGGAALGVGGMASVVAVVMKASNGVLASLPQQRGLIETLPNSG